jgi:hypothetical protein
MSIKIPFSGYISEHSRIEYWGTGVIEAISAGLQKELPGVRSFSTTTLKYMRIVYEQWQPYVNRPPMADDLQIDEY